MVIVSVDADRVVFLYGAELVTRVAQLVMKKL